LRNVIRLFRTAFFQISHLFDIRHLWRCDLHRKSMANLEKQKDPAREEEGFQVQIPYGLFSTGQVAGRVPALTAANLTLRIDVRTSLVQSFPV
jgi:hypothetical protein